MSEEEISQCVTPSLIRNIFQESIIREDVDRWVITICGKIVTVNGKMFFNSRTQAVKAFYNSYRWRAARDMHQALNREGRYWRYGTDYWKVFKKVCEKDYGLKFMRV